MSKDSKIQQALDYKSDSAKLNYTALSDKYKLTYDSWRSVKQRAKSEGIALDQRLATFAEFLYWLGPRTSKNYTLDRIDYDGPYSPDNCRWADKQVQSLNRSNAVKIMYCSELLPLKVVATRLGVPPDVLYHRRSLGWTDEEIVAGKRLPKAEPIFGASVWPEGKAQLWEEAYLQESAENELREQFYLRKCEEYRGGFQKEFEYWAENEDKQTPQEFLDQINRADALVADAKAKLNALIERRRKKVADLF
jgi:hypothetical protein